MGFPIRKEGETTMSNNLARRDFLEFGTAAVTGTALSGLVSKNNTDAGVKPVDFPDFARGKWKTRQPIEFL